MVMACWLSLESRWDVLSIMVELAVALAIVCSDSGDLGCDGGDQNCELQRGQDDYFLGGLQQQTLPRLINMRWLAKSQG